MQLELIKKQLRIGTNKTELVLCTAAVGIHILLNTVNWLQARIKQLDILQYNTVSTLNFIVLLHSNCMYIARQTSVHYW